MDRNTLMNGQIKNWNVSKKPSISDHNIIRFGIEGIIKNLRITDWDYYAMHLSNNMALLQRGGDSRSELEFETVVEDLKKVVIDAYVRLIVKSSRVPW